MAYGTKHISDRLKEFGHQIDLVAVCGGLTKSDLYIQVTSDVLGIKAVKPLESESVMLGSAIMAKAAYEKVPLEKAILSMKGPGIIHEPDLKTADFHSRKYSVFLNLISDQQKYAQIMRSGNGS